MGFVKLGGGTICPVSVARAETLGGQHSSRWVMVRVEFTVRVGVGVPARVLSLGESRVVLVES